MDNAKWENWTNLVIGIIFFLTPWLISNNLATDVADRVSWNSWVVGAAVAISAGFALQDLKPWEEWVNLALGVWMILSPWIFNYSKESGLLWSSLAFGAIVTALSGISIPIAQRLQHDRT